jgi:hypothetical protein
MTTPKSLQLTTLPVTVDNPDDWGEIERRIAAETGTAPAITPDVLAMTVGSAVPMLFAADGSGDADMLRGTFSDQVLTQRRNQLGSLGGEVPVSVTLHLVGAPSHDGHAVIRAHVVVATRSPDGSSETTGMFWDLSVDTQVVVGQSSCPNCGAPLAAGCLVCDHCHTDVRQVTNAPLVVTRLEMY